MRQYQLRVCPTTSQFCVYVRLRALFTCEFVCEFCVQFLRERFTCKICVWICEWILRVHLLQDLCELFVWAFRRGLSLESQINSAIAKIEKIERDRWAKFIDYSTAPQAWPPPPKHTHFFQSAPPPQCKGPFQLVRGAQTAWPQHKSFPGGDDPEHQGTITEINKPPFSWLYNYYPAIQEALTFPSHVPCDKQSPVIIQCASMTLKLCFWCVRLEEHLMNPNETRLFHAINLILSEAYYKQQVPLQAFEKGFVHQHRHYCSWLSLWRDFNCGDVRRPVLVNVLGQLT